MLVEANNLESGRGGSMIAIAWRFDLGRGE
jgi:hypothetical protein